MTFFMNRDQIYDFITEYRPVLINQLQKEIVDYLYDESVLTADEYHDIRSYETRENQIISILDKLPSKDKGKFEIFMKYIYQWYKWIIGKHFNNNTDQDNYSKEVQRILSEGGVPPLPQRHVRRREEFLSLCSCLHNLKRDEYVVVHGMRGSGKSTLVSEVLQLSYSLILDAFQKKVFWLTVGRESSVEELTIQQELCMKVTSFRSLQSLPLDSKSAKQFLKERLKSEEFEECLLVLDDVSSASFIEAFDVGCKILVTTDDKNIMHKTLKKIQYVKVSEGFKEDETLKLFSDSIGSEQLPNQAKLIHMICKGFPLTISLIGSQLAEHKYDVLHNPDRWEVYVAKLRDKNISGAIGQYDKHKSDQVSSLYKAIGMRIDSLENILRELYQDFALFMDDVNIKPEVLCTLWGLNKKEVEDIMLEFANKSFVIRTWNRQLLSYIYCVHDLLLDYLKKQLTKDQKITLHRKLINAYQSKYGSDFTRFPRNDNYIYLYLGYHLKEASLFDEFPRWYLDLKFIEVKILTNGPADVLFDYKKYKTYIANNAENTKLYEDFVCFVKRIGICRCLSNSDIVQFGLCESKESSVYKLAVQLQKTKKEKYFEFMTDAPKENSPPFVYYGREEIVAAVFENDDIAIVADTTNNIKIINILKNHTLAKFQGHTEKITSLKLMKNNKFYFLSTSNDSTVRIWYKSIYTNQEVNYEEKSRTPSPQSRQPFYEDCFINLRLAGEKAVAVLVEHESPITCAQFSNSGMMVLTAGEDHKVVIWNFCIKVRQTEIEFEHDGHFLIKTEDKIVSCDFSNDDKLVLCASDKGSISIYDSKDGSYISSISTENDIKSLFVLPEIKQLKQAEIMIFGENYFYAFSILPKDEDDFESHKNLHHNLVMQRKRDDHYICATVSWDGKYIAVASANYTILIYEISTGKEVLKYSESNGKIRNLSWCRSNNALLAAYGNSILKIWNVQPESILNNTKLRPTTFDAAWVEDLLVTAAVNSNNEIHIFYDLCINKIIRRDLLLQDEIYHIYVSPVDGNIVYAYKNGSLHLVVLDKWNMYNIVNVNYIRIIKMKVFYHESQYLIVMSVEETCNQYLLVAYSVTHNLTNSTISTKEILRENSLQAYQDFFAQLSNNHLFVIKDNHVLCVFDYSTNSLEYSEEMNKSICSNRVIFCDISSNFTYVATGNDRSLFLRTIATKRKTFVLDFDKEMKPKTCKFSPNENIFIVGFSDGSLQIFDVENNSVMRKLNNVFGSPVIELIWSLNNYHVLLILDREIALCEISLQDDKLMSVLYMSVDKIIHNDKFNQFITIDSSGYLHVMKHT